MELSQAQYDFINETMQRYKFWVDNSVKVWNDTDVKKAIQVLGELGLPDPTGDCDVCNDGQYARTMFAQLYILFDKYGVN